MGLTRSNLKTRKILIKEIRGGRRKTGSKRDGKTSKGMYRFELG